MGNGGAQKRYPRKMNGCTIGLVGFGNVSQKLAERLQGFKVKILAYDPYVSDDILAKYGRKGLNSRIC